jgi:hypothetical protein
MEYSREIFNAPSAVELEAFRAAKSGFLIRSN